MKTLTVNETTLRLYLLGNLPEEEAQEITEWLLTEESAYDRVDAAEDDLIDEFLSGELAAADLCAFHDCFLAAPARKEKLQFGLSLWRTLDSVSAKSASPEVPANAVTRPVWRPFSSGYAAALILLAAGLAGWGVVKNATLQGQVDSVRKELAAVEAQRTTMAARLAEAERTQPQGAAAAIHVAAAFLDPGVRTRSADETQSIPVSSEMDTVQFSLRVSHFEPNGYSVALLNDDDQKLWSQQQTPASGRYGATALVVQVPASLLPEGNYRLTLGAVPTGPSIETFAFRILRP